MTFRLRLMVSSSWFVAGFADHLGYRCPRSRGLALSSTAFLVVVILIWSCLLPGVVLRSTTHRALWLWLCRNAWFHRWRATMTDTQSINWKIFCVVVDEKVPFSVKIQSDATVDELKKAIKEKQKPKLDNFAASDLTLFKADLSDGADLEENANRLLATKPTPLMATDELSQILQPAPSKGKIHILVQPPTSTLIVRTQSEENEASDVLTPLRKTKGMPPCKSQKLGLNLVPVMV